MKEHANVAAGPRAEGLRDFKPFQAWLKEKRLTYTEWERRQSKHEARGDTPTAVLRMKLDLADAQTRRN